MAERGDSFNEQYHSVAPASGQGVLVKPGTVVSIADVLSLRGKAGHYGEVLDSLVVGATATVLSGPTVVDDYSWYERDVDGVTG